MRHNTAELENAAQDRWGGKCGKGKCDRTWGEIKICSYVTWGWVYDTLFMHLPSPFIIIIQHESSCSFYHPAEGVSSSRPTGTANQWQRIRWRRRHWPRRWAAAAEKMWWPVRTADLCHPIVTTARTCLVAPCNVRITLVPCSHQRFCDVCADQVHNLAHCCPICRNPTSMLLHLYWDTAMMITRFLEVNLYWILIAFILSVCCAYCVLLWQNEIHLHAIDALHIETCGCTRHKIFLAYKHCFTQASHFPHFNPDFVPHFPPLQFCAGFSISHIFHPCIFLVPHFPFPDFLPLQFCATFSFPASSNHAILCHIILSHIVLFLHFQCSHLTSNCVHTACCDILILSCLTFRDN